jgi:histidyl-tRNA synthetase
MKRTLEPVRGTHDLLPGDMAVHRHVEQTALATLGRYGFAEMATPIFEFSDVFARTLGETSDIVTKEMYSFEDKGGDRITLRPEGTAGVARAFISNGLAQELPLKLSYRGPMFRYERPQKGRQRQFHQIGVELLGVESPLGDVEVIAAGYQLLEALGLGEKVVLELNSLGDGESRSVYREALVTFLGRHREGLSDDSRARLERNPLRILDSKDEGDRRILQDAPAMTDYLNDTSRTFFAKVQSGLTAAGIPYRINPALVRGLDYYAHTAFEFTTTALGAQGTVLAGGRYDGLIEMMGGPPTPGVGWAAGVERLALLVGAAPPGPRPVAVIPFPDTPWEAAIALSQTLRRAGLAVDIGYSGNVGKRLKRANKVNARFAVLMGEAERARGAVTLRDMETGEQREIGHGEIGDVLLAAERARA